MPRHFSEWTIGDTSKSSLLFLKLQLRKVSDDLHCLQGHRDDTLEELEWVSWVVHRLVGIVVGVVDDAARCSISKDQHAFLPKERDS